MASQIWRSRRQSLSEWPTWPALACWSCSACRRCSTSRDSAAVSQGALAGPSGSFFQTTQARATAGRPSITNIRSEEHTSELQSQSNLVCRLLLEKKKKNKHKHIQGIYTTWSRIAGERSGERHRLSC